MVHQEEKRQLQQLRKQLQEKDNLILSQNQQLQSTDQLQQQKRLLQEEKSQLLEEIASLERKVQQLKLLFPSEGYRSLLQGQELLNKDCQLTTQSLQEPVQRSQLLSQLSLREPDYIPRSTLTLNMTLKWKDGGKAPFGMNRGAAVVDGNVAYFMDCRGEACSYDSSSKKWSNLPRYPYQDGCLVVINGLLTGIGGCIDAVDYQTYTDKLLGLSRRRLSKCWVEFFPPMSTKRRSATALTSKEYLIVAGGLSGPPSIGVSIVEVMDIKNLVWSSVGSLPDFYHRVSTTICGDNIYMLGGYCRNSLTKSVLICSLSSLVQSSPLQSLWRRVADAPYFASTCASISGEMLAVGGCGKDGRALTA